MTEKIQITSVSAMIVSPISSRLIELECPDGIEVFDGHHTLEELYEHRMVLFIALCKAYDSYVTPLNFPHVRCWKSLLHDDGTSYDGWFILGISRQKIPFNASELITTQHIAYHLPMKYWDKIDVIKLEKAPPFDGYTAKDVLERLLKL